MIAHYMGAGYTWNSSHRQQRHIYSAVSQLCSQLRRVVDDQFHFIHQSAAFYAIQQWFRIQITYCSHLYFSAQTLFFLAAKIGECGLNVINVVNVV